MTRFELGETVATSGAVDLLSRGGDWRANGALYLWRHASGDWGDVPPADARENQRSLKHGLRVLSSYEHEGERLWIITEADRSSTCLLLPSEY